MLKVVTGAALMATALSTSVHAATWDNFYVGGVGTLGMMSSDVNDSEGYIGGATQANWGGGFGGTVGKNWQMGSFVWGVEADGSWTDFKNSLTSNVCCITVETESTQWNWNSTLRARLGVDIDDTLIYGTGGVAFVGVKTRVTYLDSEGGDMYGPLPESKTETGIALGVGLERRISDNLTLKGEYIYIGLPNSTNNTYYDLTTHTNECSDYDCGSATFRSSAQMFRIGLNWQFDQ